MPQNQINRQRCLLFIGSFAGKAHALLTHLAADPGYTCEEAETGVSAAALALRTGQQFDAMLIDVDHAGGDSAAICARLREDGINVPILLIAETSDERTVIHGLNSGANDYIQAPFRMPEVAARLRAQIRGYEVSEEAVITVGPFKFCPARRMLQHSTTNKLVRLTTKESATLLFLYWAQGHVPRDTLLAEVWGYNDKATSRTIETHIYRLRQKIEPDPTNLVLLVNESGGYRLRLNQRPPIPECAPLAGAMAA